MEDNALMNYGKNLFEIMLEKNPFVDAAIKTLKEQNDKILIERIEYLNSEIAKLKDFESKMKYLTSDEAKFVHVKNFISFYFTRTDPALVETNIKIFLDYINEKNAMDIYDKLLDKMCLLNKEALNVLKKIKNNLKEDNYYDWKDFIKLYPNINSNLRYRDIMTSKNQNNDMLEVSFGLKTLIENEFIISMSTNYPGSIDVYNVDKFSLTGLGFLILEYI
ncbi:MAG: hypothetical protein UC703_04455 [Bacilli bacterium]|nr:hypothetical protein [Bacilli bacterium]